jgi:hypothetical protein
MDAGLYNLTKAQYVAARPYLFCSAVPLCLVVPLPHLPLNWTKSGLHIYIYILDFAYNWQKTLVPSGPIYARFTVMMNIYTAEKSSWPRGEIGHVIKISDIPCVSPGHNCGIWWTENHPRGWPRALVDDPSDLINTRRIDCLRAESASTCGLWAFWPGDRQSTSVIRSLASSTRAVFLLERRKRIHWETCHNGIH